ncbi:hypothetical protein [Castellaniella sp.]|uniref:hypothetical protein n=1 Tax=Castellaniella sp. TaxID=1955812 RepID=UPI002AFFB2BD|nr:hypothetical protein [Castellaniella sp.]
MSESEEHQQRGQAVFGPGQQQEIELARQGDKLAFSRLYRLAGVFLAAGLSLPDELAAFMAERMDAIGRALEQADTRKALPDAVAPRLKRGRPAKRVDMLVEVAKAANDLHRPGGPMGLKKQIVYGLAEQYGFDPEAVKTTTHVVKRKR